MKCLLMLWIISAFTASVTLKAERLLKYDAQYESQYKLQFPVHFRPGKSEIKKDSIAQVKVLSPYWKDETGRTAKLERSMKYEDLMPSFECPLSTAHCLNEQHFRRIDGACGSSNDTFGISGDFLTRIARPQYDKGLMRMLSKSGGFLSNPRSVSRMMQNLSPRIAPTGVNVFWLFFGQFLDHDISHILMVKERNPKPSRKLNCKKCSSWQDHFGCAPLPISSKDNKMPAFHKNGQANCIPFTRSAAKVVKYSGRLSLEQINVNTAYLDLSTIYGSDQCVSRKLRLFSDGQMIETNHPTSSKGLPPFKNAENFDDCRSDHGKCAYAGDKRTNEHIGLTVFHVLYLREHNRLAKALSHYNPTWEDKRLFQEARRINIAQYQRTVYEDFLPSLLGSELMHAYDLYIHKKSHLDFKNENVNPQVSSEFSVAAFRIGHTMVPNDIITRDKYYFPSSSYSLVGLFRNSSVLTKEKLIEEVTRGMIGTAVKGNDPIIEENLHNKLFMFPSVPHTAEDLMAINIARGRDHGIPGYTTYLKICNLREIRRWNELDIAKDDIRILQTVYDHVDDIDLIVGGLMEKPLPGAIVGPTFGCIIANQFYKTKMGDKFWFESKENHLTGHQLHTLKTGNSMFRLLSHNLDENELLPKNIFKLPDAKRNPLILSSEITDIDLSLWKEANVNTRLRCFFKDLFYEPGDKIDASPCLHCYCDQFGKINCLPNDTGCSLSSNLSDDSCKLVCGT